MHRPVCVKCEREFVIAQEGVGVVDINSKGMETQLWAADLMVCPSCGLEILSGFARMPVANFWEEKFVSFMESFAQSGRGLYRSGV